MEKQEQVKGVTFEQWKTRVNRVVEQFYGLSCDGLPDWDYYDAWQSGISPGHAAAKAVKAAKNY